MHESSTRYGRTKKENKLESMNPHKVADDDDEINEAVGIPNSDDDDETIAGRVSVADEEGAGIWRIMSFRTTMRFASSYRSCSQCVGSCRTTTFE